MLTGKSFMTKIGAESTWQETNGDVYDNFVDGGDWMMVCNAFFLLSV